MIRTLDSLVRSNLWIYHQVRRSAVYLCRYVLLEEGFSFLKFITPQVDAVAIDIGSNDGTSIEMIRQVHSNNTIHSFDPVIAPSKSYDSVNFHKVAISQNIGSLEIFIPKIGQWKLTQYSSSDPEKVVSQLMGDFHINRDDIEFSHITSDCLPLDSFNLNPYFIKVDVEGQEESVIKGSLKTIVTSRPILLIEIQSLESYRSIRSILNSIDYFNLRWPQGSHRKDFNSEGSYSRKSNNFLWIPRSSSHNWSIEKTR